MKIEKGKVLGGTAAGERDSRHYWPGDAGDEDGVDYEALFKSFMEKLFSNRGAFKVDGSLLFEFQPKASVRNEKLITAETAFFFHQMEEKKHLVVADIHKNDNYKDSAMDSYQYQRKAMLQGGRFEEFMPVI